MRRSLISGTIGLSHRIANLVGGFEFDDPSQGKTVPAWEGQGELDGGSNFESPRKMSLPKAEAWHQKQRVRKVTPSKAVPSQVQTNVYKRPYQRQGAATISRTFMTFAATLRVVS